VVKAKKGKKRYCWPAQIKRRLFSFFFFLRERERERERAREERKGFEHE